MKPDKIIVLVMDSVGIGELPDAGEYGDEGSNTFAHTARALGGLNVPNLAALGIGNLTGIPGVPPAQRPLGAYGRMGEEAKGKDTTTGHWEMMGVILHKALPTYPNGFPADLMAEYERAIGRGTLGNTVASGTEIIAGLGEEHVRTGKPIVYTSADSVFQVAAHEGVIPLEELYRICRIAREMLVGEHNVARVIARPFEGEAGAFKRTGNRKDFSLEPPGTTVLDALTAAGTDVYAIGKIEDIFANRGMTGVKHTKGNKDTLEETVRAAGERKGLIFANAVDFDMLYGHRNDAEGYGKALEGLDSYIPRIMDAMGPEGMLFITADHGCDPTTPSTDHSREYVPVLVCGDRVKQGVDLGTRGTFADLGATVADLLGVPWNGPGTSFAGSLLGDSE